MQSRIDSLGTAAFAALLVVLLSACSDGGDAPADSGPFAELYQQGITRYLGLYTPMLSEPGADDSTIHTFGGADGPLCLRGAPYAMGTRDQGSADLHIFLEGGGACWSDVCVAIPEANPVIPSVGIMDIHRQNNPVRTWNQVYIPYCDGSLHAGDRDVDGDGDGSIDRFHRGLHNLSAALDVAARTFPAPRRILLSGHSGGGLGSIFALPLVRFLYPDAQIDVVNDSGVGVSRPGDPGLLNQLLAEWNLGAFLPAGGCPGDCIGADGHLTEYLVWQMDEDTSITRAMLSYTRDIVFTATFLQIDGAAFEKALLEEMRQQREAHPGRTQTFIPAGFAHTFLQLEPDKTAGGVNLMDWIGLMLDGSPGWTSVADPVAGAGWQSDFCPDSGCAPAP